MSKKGISLKIDDDLLKKVDEYAESRYISRSEAIRLMLSNNQLFLIKETPEIINLLHYIFSLQKSNYLSNDDKKLLREVCYDIWQLLNSII